MAKVWFRCNRKNEKMFILNSIKEIDNIPLVGDFIVPSDEDFRKATFRVKPWIREKNALKNSVYLHFKVVSRSYDIPLNEWELICEPTSETLIYLLSTIKT